MRIAPFTAVVISRDVVLSITDLARGSHPLEFTCLLEGKVRQDVRKDARQKDAARGVLFITGLIYQQYESSEDATATHLNLPLLHNTVGSVHSHPGGSNRPSRTDLLSFNKNGIVHLIIKEPYREADIAAYDKNGRPVHFSAASDMR